MEKVRVRYAPSPTGFLHAGQIRTALFNYLFAKNAEMFGKEAAFILRIEDTDRERSKEEYENAIYEDLRWLGIEPDESPVHGGKHGPYRQSERTGRYQENLEKLLLDGKAYWCDHKEFDRHEVFLCQDGDRESGGISEKGIIRFKNPFGREFDKSGQPPYKLNTHNFTVVSFEDKIRGNNIEFTGALLGDFSIAKNLESPLYNFAVVIDDHDMEITDVIRGEDHIPNTPKQKLLYEALEFEIPKYAHIPLVLGADRSKLSKRTGAKSIAEYRSEGYLPEALLNFLALLGWNPGDKREIFTKEELIKEFSLEKVQKSGAIFDIAKLDWMNGEYIRMLSIEDLYERIKSFLPAEAEKYPKDFILKILALEQPRLKKLSEIGERTDYFFREPEYNKELLRWKDMSDRELADSLDKSMELLQSPRLKSDFNQKDAEKVFLGEIGAGDKGRILWPLRVALTGKKASPGPFEILEILGETEARKRLEKARSLFS